MESQPTVSTRGSETPPMHQSIDGIPVPAHLSLTADVRQELYDEDVPKLEEVSRASAIFMVILQPVTTSEELFNVTSPYALSRDILEEPDDESYWEADLTGSMDIGMDELV